MKLRGKELFSSEQGDIFMKIPEDDFSLATYYTFSKQDLEIIKNHRTKENKIGFAMQLAFLRYPGWPYAYIKNVPKTFINHIGKQIGVSISYAKKYPQRENTLWEHLKEIKNNYGYVSFNEKESLKIFNHLHNLCLENNETIFLFEEALDFFRLNKIIFPGITTIEKIILKAKFE